MDSLIVIKYLIQEVEKESKKRYFDKNQTKTREYLKTIRRLTFDIQREMEEFKESEA